MGSTADVIEFIADTGFESLPSEAIQSTKLQILDCLGVALAASRRALAGLMVSQLREMGGKGQATVIGHPFKVSYAEAAWTNGTIAHALDFDDNSIDLPTAIHQTATSLPAALSIGELVSATGRDLILAVTLGIEAASKVDRALNGCPQAYHGTGVFGTLASAVSAGKLLNLDPEQLEHALGIACSLAAGLEANFGTMTKPLHAGQASRGGVISALLAKKGFTSAKGILETAHGFAELCERRLDQGYLKRSLGNPWEVVEPGIHLKAYPACMLTHAGLDAVLEIARTYQINPAYVKEVEVTTRRALGELIHSEPKTGLEAKFSMQFCIAIGLVTGQATLNEFTDEKIRDPAVIDLGRKVRLSVDPELPGSGLLATRARVVMDDGSRYERLVESPRGSKKNPMTVDEVVQKFRSCAEMALPTEKVGEVVEVVLHLERLEGVNNLSRLLVDKRRRRSVQGEISTLARRSSGG